MSVTKYIVDDVSFDNGTLSLKAGSRTIGNGCQISIPSGPMIYKGTLGSGGTTSTLPTTSTSNTGWTYKVATAGTYAGQAAKIGDMFISTGTEWSYVPSGDEPEYDSLPAASGGTDKSLVLTGDKYNWNQDALHIGVMENLTTTEKSNLVGAINELKNSVSDGKATVATAITNQGVQTSSTASFSTMATNIGGILAANPGTITSSVEVYENSSSSDRIDINSLMNIDTDGYHSSSVGTRTIGRKQLRMYVSGRIVTVKDGSTIVGQTGVDNGSATPSVTIASGSTDTITITPTASVGTAGYISSISNGTNKTLSISASGGTVTVKDGSTTVGQLGLGVETAEVTAGTSDKTVPHSTGKEYFSEVTVHPTPTQVGSATPSSAAQTINPDTGKYFSKVTVAAIPTATPTHTVTIPSGTSSSFTATASVSIGSGKWVDSVTNATTKVYLILDNTAHKVYASSASSRGTGVTDYAEIAVPTSYSLETKTVTLSNTPQTQTITPSSGKDAMTSVEVTMPSGSTSPDATLTAGTTSFTITPKTTNTAGYISVGTPTGTDKTISLSVSGKTVTAKNGTTSLASASVSNGSATPKITYNAGSSSDTFTITPGCTVNTAGYISSISDASASTIYLIASGGSVYACTKNELSGSIASQSVSTGSVTSAVSIPSGTSTSFTITPSMTFSAGYISSKGTESTKTLYLRQSGSYVYVSSSSSGGTNYGRITKTAGSATPSISITSGTTNFTITPKATVGTAGHISSISDGTASTVYLLKNGDSVYASSSSTYSSSTNYAKYDISTETKTVKASKSSSGGSDTYTPSSGKYFSSFTVKRWQSMGFIAWSLGTYGSGTGGPYYYCNEEYGNSSLYRAISNNAGCIYCSSKCAVRRESNYFYMMMATNGHTAGTIRVGLIDVNPNQLNYSDAGEAAVYYTEITRRVSSSYGIIQLPLLATYTNNTTSNGKTWKTGTSRGTSISIGEDTPLYPFVVTNNDFAGTVMVFCGFSEM